MSSGLNGFARIKSSDPRARRNAARLAHVFEDLVMADPLALDNDGRFSITLGVGLEVSSSALRVDAGNGLTFSSNDLIVNLGDGLVFNSGAIDVSPGDGLALSGGNVVVDLATDPGLEFNSGDLRIAAATETVRGGVLLQDLVDDVGVLTDNSGGTDGSGTIAAIGVAVTDPADTPADADTLRDDLVANTIPSVETELTNLRNAVATLAAYCTTLEDKINEMIASQKTAEQMNTV